MAIVLWQKLTNVIVKVKDTKFVATMASKKIKWTFYLPYAPHFGGVFETMIKAVKRQLLQ